MVTRGARRRAALTKGDESRQLAQLLAATVTATAGSGLAVDADIRAVVAGICVVILVIVLVVTRLPRRRALL